MNDYVLLTTILLFMGIVVKSGISFVVEKEQDLDFGKHFRPKEHLFYERCSVCGKKLKHYRWFWGAGDCMSCEVDYCGNAKWYCKDCNDELEKNTVYTYPTI